MNNLRFLAECSLWAIIFAKARVHKRAVAAFRFFFMLDDWVTNDGSSDNKRIFGNDVAFEIQRGMTTVSTGTVSPNRIWDNVGSNNGEYTAGDGSIAFDLTSRSFSYLAGDVVTFKANPNIGETRGVSNGVGTFNPQSHNRDVLNIRLGNGNWNLTSGEGVFVPEPTTYALLLGGAALAVAVFRQRTQARKLASRK